MGIFHRVWRDQPVGVGVMYLLPVYLSLRPRASVFPPHTFDISICSNNKMGNPSNGPAVVKWFKFYRSIDQ